MYQRTSTDVEMGVLDADKAFSAVLEHTRTLDEREYVYLQNAVLYTTRDGQRRLRTCNLALSVTILARDVFQFADVDAVVCQLARECESLLFVCLVSLPMMTWCSDGKVEDATDGADTGGADGPVCVDAVGIPPKLCGRDERDTGERARERSTSRACY